MLACAPNAAVLDAFIDQQVERLFTGFSSELMRQFSHRAKLLFQADILFDKAQRLLLRHSASDRLLHKVRQIV
jgi:hypothetical protein